MILEDEVRGKRVFDTDLCCCKTSAHGIELANGPLPRKGAARIAFAVVYFGCLDHHGESEHPH